jgi:hypothetical protein
VLQLSSRRVGDPERRRDISRSQKPYQDEWPDRRGGELQSEGAGTIIPRALLQFDDCELAAPCWRGGRPFASEAPRLTRNRDAKLGHGGTSMESAAFAATRIHAAGTCSGRHFFARVRARRPRISRSDSHRFSTLLARRRNHSDTRRIIVPRRNAQGLTVVTGRPYGGSHAQ